MTESVFVEVIRELSELDIYSASQRKEYIDSFICSDDLDTLSGSSSKLIERISARKPIEPATPNMSSSPKLTTIDSLVAMKRSVSTPLGIVSGSFDLLHLNHIRGFVYARQHLDRSGGGTLCALVLSDDAIRSKKGEDRPILDLNERMSLIAGVTAIDWVAPLSQPNCLDALERLRPAFFFKAARDFDQPIVLREMEIVRSYGGEVVEIPREIMLDISTTSIIERIRKDLELKRSHKG